MTIKETTLATGEKFISFSENPELCAAIEKMYNIKVYPVTAPVGFISTINGVEMGTVEDDGDEHLYVPYVCRSCVAGKISMEALQDLHAIHGVDGEIELLVMLLQTAFGGMDNIPNPFLGYMFASSPIILDEENLKPVKIIKLRWGEMSVPCQNP